MQPTIDIAQALARHGRVRQLADDATVLDVFRRMDKTQAVGLLYDGAGWDALRISGELGLNPREVRLSVAKARLQAEGASCTPCPAHLDGLMTFAADAIDHSMTCVQCEETRRVLRSGKLVLRDQWRRESRAAAAMGITTPTTNPTRSAAAHSAPPSPRRDRHAGRPRRAAVQLAERSSVSGTTVGRTLPDVAARPYTESSQDTSPAPRWRPTPSTPPADPVDRHTVVEARTRPWPAPSVSRPTPQTALDVNTTAADVAVVERADVVFPELDIPDREPPGIAATPMPSLPRPDGPLVSLPDRTPGRRNLARHLTEDNPSTFDATPRVSGPRRMLVTVFATVVAITGRIPRLPAVAALAVVAIVTAVALAWNPLSSDAEEDVANNGEFDAVTAGQAEPPESVGDGAGAQDAALVGADQQIDLAESSAAPAIRPTDIPAPSNPDHPTIGTWQELAMCESSGNWNINSGNGFYGGLQFTLESWRLVGGKGFPHDHPALEQIRRAERLLELQGWIAWPVCSVDLGLR